MIHMKKYIVLLKAEIISNLEHRVNNGLHFLAGLVLAVLSYFSRLTIYRESGTLKGFDKEDILPYS